MPNIPGDIRSYRREGITRTLSFPPEIKIGIIGVVDYSKVVNFTLQFPLVVELTDEKYERFWELTHPVMEGVPEPGDYYNVFSFIQDNLIYVTKVNDGRINNNYNENAASILDIIEYESGKYIAVVNLQRLSYVRPDPGVGTLWGTPGSQESRTLVNVWPVWERYYPIDLVLLSLYLIDYEVPDPQDPNKNLKFSSFLSLSNVSVSTISFRKTVLVGSQESQVDKTFALNSEFRLSKVKIKTESRTVAGRSVIAPIRDSEEDLTSFSIDFSDYKNSKFFYNRSQLAITLHCARFDIPAAGGRNLYIDLPRQTLSVTHITAGEIPR